MRWIFGPVPSRRFGRSLGIDLFSRKTCTFNCVYCEVGKAEPNENASISACAPVSEVLAELSEYLTAHSDDLPDFITFAGSGEPTLHGELDAVIKGIKSMTTVPVVLLTNGSLLHHDSVLRRVLDVDYLVPSLDAGCERVFRMINRPHPGLTFNNLIGGLLAARRVFKGHYILEVLLVDGINTGPVELEKLKMWIDEINPDAVQINTVFRPPAEQDISAASQSTIDRFAAMIGDKAEPVAYYTEKGTVRLIQGELLDRVILKTVGIRPCTLRELADSIGVSEETMGNAITRLKRDKQIEEITHNGATHIGISKKE